MEISHVKSLALIDASFNHIQFIGMTVETLPRLEFLNLDSNCAPPEPAAQAEPAEEANLAAEPEVGAVVGSVAGDASAVSAAGPASDPASAAAPSPPRSLAGSSSMPPDPNPLMVGIGTRTRRLLERHALLISKGERRSLIQRALGVRSTVLRREEQQIVAEQLKQALSKDGSVDEYP